MLRRDRIKLLDEEINRELSDLLTDEAAILARRREFMESEAVRSHMEKHANATLVFTNLEPVKHEGLAGIASDDWMKFRFSQEPKSGVDGLFSSSPEKKAQKQSEESEEISMIKKEADKKFMGYQAAKDNKPGFGGYTGKEAEEASFGGYMGGQSDKSVASVYGHGGSDAVCSDCGCGFSKQDDGNIVQKGIPGQEAAAAGVYGALGAQGQQGYSASSGHPKAAYSAGQSNSSRVRYGR